MITSFCGHFFNRLNFGEVKKKNIIFSSGRSKNPAFSVKNMEDHGQMSQSPKSSAHCINIGRSSQVVLLDYPHKAYLSGIVNVKAVRGTIRILGYDLTPESGPVTVYSIKEFNTLAVTPVKNAKVEYDLRYLDSLSISQKEIDRIESLCFSHIFVVFRDEDCGALFSYLANFGLSRFIKMNNDDRPVKLRCADEENVLLEGCEWDELSDEFLRAPRKLVICGGKNVGKSTFLRYLVNRCLSKWSKVLVLDFDPGQSEFTVMGCLSAVIVENPMLGPNFSHIKTPERSIYLGDISVTCSRLYAESIGKLVSFCNTFNYEKIPWIVNTMGFSRGLGITLLGLIMEAVKPTDVVQINSKKEQTNFPSNLTLEFLNFPNFKGHWKSHVLSSMPEGNDKPSGVRLRDPALKRNIFTLSYFKKALTSVNIDLLSVIPKKMKINVVRIVITKPTSKNIEMSMTNFQKLCCINANLVILCNENSINEINCLGFGIVRGFDTDANFIYVITPLSEESLSGVTVIKMDSSLQLPFIFYKQQADQINRFYPHMNYKIADKLNQPIRKTTSRLRFMKDT